MEMKRGRAALDGQPMAAVPTRFLLLRRAALFRACILRWWAKKKEQSSWLESACVPTANLYAESNRIVVPSSTCANDPRRIRAFLSTRDCRCCNAPGMSAQIWAILPSSVWKGAGTPTVIRVTAHLEALEQDRNVLFGFKGP